MIVKHRRGTLEAWEKTDVIPEEGELIIVEFKDGSRRCKVGEDNKPFKDLHYIDEKTQNKLLDDLARTEASLKADLMRTEEAINNELVELKQEFAGVLDKKALELQQEISTLSAEHTVGMAQVDDKLTSLSTSHSKLSAALNSVTAQHQADIAQVVKQINDSAVELDNKLTEHTEAINGTVAGLGKNLTADYEQQIAEASDTLRTQINSVDSNSKASIATLRDQASGITSRISDINTWVANLDKLSTELVAADTALSESLEVIRQQGNTVSTELTEQLGLLREKVANLSISNSKLSIQLKNADLKIDNTFEQLNSELVAKKQQHSADYVRLLTELSRIEEAQAVADISLSDVMLEQVAKIYLEIADLVDDDLLILRRLFKSEAKLADDIKALDTRITEGLINIDTSELEQKLADSIAAVNSTLTENLENLKTSTVLKLMEMQGSVDASKADIKALTASTVSKFEELSKEAINNKNELLDNIDDISTQVDEANERITAVDTKLDTNTAVLHARMNTFEALPDGSTTADGELTDIRVGYDGTKHTSAGDAVRAIGNSLVSLRDSLSQYIDTQAIDGLHYDYIGEVGLKQPYMLYLTAGGEVVQDSGVQIISGAGGGGGGSSTASSLKIGYITTSPVVTTVNDKTILKFTFEGADSSGDTILQAASTWKVNNVTVEYGTVNDGENEFDVTKYLSVGTTKVLLVVTDDNGSTVTKSWSVQQIDLSVDSTFDDKSTYSVYEDLVFTYIPNGSVEKTAVFKLDGEELDRVTLTADISGTEAKYRIPPQTHGSHLLEFYLEADINGSKVSSNHAIKDILFYDPANNIPVIGCSTPTLKTKQYSTVNIVYTVYDPKSEEPTVTIEVDGTVVSTTTVTNNPNYNNTPTAVYSYTETVIGPHVIKIICRDQVKEIIVDVEDLGVVIAPVTTGLAFDFNPAGKTNGDVANRLWSQGDIHMTVSDNFDWVNGGYIPDDPDGPCFCIKAGSTAVIDYKLFANDAKKYGKELKLVFKTKNVANPDAVFLSCLDNTTDRDHIGFEMGIHNAYVYGQSGSLELAYSEEDVIEFEFNISKNTEKVPMVMGYEDGVPSRPMVYDDTYSFTQSTSKVITLGSPDCDVFIYRFKVYNTSLTATDILNNFIADARTAEEMISRYNRNQIYDENHKLTPEALAEKCPWLRVYKVSAPHFTNNKSDKVSNTTIQQLYKNGDPVLDNWICRNAQHSGQGTSSNNYGAAGRNLDFIMNKSNSYFELGDGTATNKITLTRESVPTAYLNAKVNIASSNNLTNAILAKKYNQFNPYRRPFVARDGINLDYIKDTMEFHNCVIFIQETDPNLTTHREFADTDWHFYAIGNIGDSKKTDDTRLTDPDDKYECCVEIMDVELPLSDFPVDTMIDAMGYEEDETTHEKTYIWAKDENLGILYEKQADGSYILTSDTVVDLTKTYYVDILEHDDFSEDFTYGWRYISDDEDPDVVNTCKQAWIDFYRFVTRSSDADFKAHFEDYFVKDSALYYYLFTTRYCMVDNRAKNTFWHYGKTSDGTRKWDLCWDYDNDTSLGLNNYGKQVYRYGLEDTDRDEKGEEVFREMDSTFFCRVRDCFASELKTMYNTLESQNAWHAESFIKECDDWQSEFPEELWRIDIDRKYIRTYTSSFINGKGDAQFLTNMSNGKMKYHRRQWERSQAQYIASKYQTATAAGENSVFRCSVPTGELAVQPNYRLKLTPYAYMYLNVKYGTNSPIQVKATPNKEFEIPFTGAGADIIDVYSASLIQDFGDLSTCYVTTADTAKASRIRKLTLGNETDGYTNPGFTTLTTGANPLLEEINVENVTGLTQSLDLRELINLRKLFAFGTNVPGALFADGGKLEYVELPAINNISLKNLIYLSSDNIKLSSYDSVVDLTIEDCPLVNQVDIFNKCTKLRRARLIGINFGNVTFEAFKARVFGLKGLAASGEEVANAVLVGTAHFDRLTGAQFNELKARYPQLDVTYDFLESVITFNDTDLETVIYTGTSINAADCPDPVYYGEGTTPEGMIAKPVKSSTAEFDFYFFGWATSQNVTVLTENITDEIRNEYRVKSLASVEGDRVLYPVFEARRRSYIITFINPTAPEENRVLAEISTPYGSDSDYFGAGYTTPLKLNAASPELYEFTGWEPKPEKITGPMTCYAQFAVLDSIWYTINVGDISDCVDSNGNVFNGYTLNISNSTMSITECKNNYNAAVKIPNALTFDNGDFIVTSLGGFKNHDKLELLKLPDTLLALLSEAFASCVKLIEIELPESLQTINSYALQSCSKLSELNIPANVKTIAEGAFASCANLQSITVDSLNTNFTVKQGCLISTKDNKLLQGTVSAEIPQDGSIATLGAYCFAGMPIVAMRIPEGISTLTNNTFSRCAQLQEVILPNTLKVLGATCFGWCGNLSKIDLPDELTEIQTYVFYQCALEDVVIPAAVSMIRDSAFSGITKLKTVTFKKAVDADGNVIVPSIHPYAFSNSGTAASPIVFNLPWSEQQHMDNFTGLFDTGTTTIAKDPTFGANACIFNFNYEEANS